MKIDKLFWIVLGSFFMFGFQFIPNFTSLSTSAMQLIGIFIGILILWLTVSIEWPSLLLLVALAMIPELKFSSIIASSYGNTTFVFLVYTFMLTYAFSKTSYIKMIAMKFITSSFAKRGPWWFITLYSLSILFIGSFISPTVLFFVYYPILEEIYTLYDMKKGEKLPSMLMMLTVIMCGISSGMTPIAHVFPLISMGLYQQMYQHAISYIAYMQIGIPVGLLTAFFTILLFRFIFSPDMKKLETIKMEEEVFQTSFAEKFVLWVFIIVIALWVLPGVIKPIFHSGMLFDIATRIDQFSTAMPPLIGVIVLCVVKVDQKPLLSVSEALSKGVSWPSLIMCASTLALGSALTNADIGLTSALSSTLTPVIQHLPIWFMVFIFTLWAAIQTNLSSNMVTATVVTTAVLAITSSIEVLSVASLVVIVGMMASFAFATPPAMPCVAIATGSGWTSTFEMLFYGFLAMLVSVVLASSLGYGIGLLVF